jgi:hypothetical protein
VSGPTPGPWEYLGFTNIWSSGGYKIWTVRLPHHANASVPPPAASERFVLVEGWSGSEAEANARLIAAAPDLLEALEDFLADFETWELADHPEGIPVMEPGFADIVDNARAAVKKARGKQS